MASQMQGPTFQPSHPAETYEGRESVRVPVGLTIRVFGSHESQQVEGNLSAGGVAANQANLVPGTHVYITLAIPDGRQIHCGGIVVATSAGVSHIAFRTVSPANAAAIAAFLEEQDWGSHDERTRAPS